VRKYIIITKVILIGIASAIIFVLFYTFNPGSVVTEEAPTKLPPKIPAVTIESIFTKQNDLSKLDEEKLITLIATGDVIPARGANWPAVTSGDFTYNWKKTADLLKTGDITLINLEAPLTKACPLQTEGMSFCGNARHVEGLVFAGVNTVSLANNHIGNYGQAGIDETINLLEKNKIGWSGFGNLDIKEVKNVKFGFLAFNGIGAAFNRDGIESEIKKAKQKVDLLVVSAHWGDEYVLTPRKYGEIAPDDPQEIGHLIIDAGADLIIGNHPHTVQGVELYRPLRGADCSNNPSHSRDLRSCELKEKLITYAHGNFIFDQTWSQETQEGVVGEYTFYLSSEASAKEDEIQLVNVEFHPILVDISYQPRFLSEKDGKHIIDRMLESSKLISK